jgi:hypothetical protein
MEKVNLEMALGFEENIHSEVGAKVLLSLATVKYKCSLGLKIIDLSRFRTKGRS